MDDLRLALPDSVLKGRRSGPSKIATTSNGAPVQKVAWKECSTPEPPTPRKGAGICTWNRKILLFGGDGGRGVRFNDVHIFDLETMMWQEVPTRGHVPNRISYHTMFAWNNKAVVFGGYDTDCCNEVHVLDLATFVWVDAKTNVTRGKLPKPVYGHSMCLWQDTAVVFGGQGQNASVSDRVHTLNLRSMTWQQIRTLGNGPQRCCYHTMAVWNDKGVVFGGSEDTYVYILDFRRDEAPWRWTRVQPTGEGPSRRFGHSTIVDGNRALIMFGRHGKQCFNQTHVLDLATMHWEGAEVTGPAPGERHAHVAQVVGRQIVIFGGHGGTYYNDIRLFDLDALRWHGVPVAPCPRDGHALFCHGGRAYLWGGDGGGGTRFSDFFELDLHALTWREVVTLGDVPSPRSYHSIALWRGRAVMYGGYHRTFLDDVHFLNLKTMVWSSAPVKGAIPQRRYGHTISVWRDQAILFGGKSTDATFFNDVESLNLETMVWSTVETRGTPPSPRYGHTVHVDGNLAIVFGGGGESYYNDVFTLDLTTMTWAKVATTGAPPTPCNYHSFTVWRRRAFVFGGDQGQGTRSNDMHCLDLDTMAWIPVETAGLVPHIRCTHSLTVRGNEAILFGGRDAGIYFNDIRVVDFAPELSDAAELFSTLSVVVQHRLYERRPRYTGSSSPSIAMAAAGPAPTFALARIMHGLALLPAELLMAISCFACGCAHTTLIPTKRMNERRETPSPQDHHARAVAAISVALCERVHGDLNYVPKHGPAADAVKQLLRRCKKVLETSVALPMYVDYSGRSQVVAFLWGRYMKHADEWDLLDGVYAPYQASAIMSDDDDDDDDH